MGRGSAAVLDVLLGLLGLPDPPWIESLLLTVASTAYSLRSMRSRHMSVPSAQPGSDVPRTYASRRPVCHGNRISSGRLILTSRGTYDEYDKVQDIRAEDEWRRQHWTVIEAEYEDHPGQDRRDEQSRQQSPDFYYRPPSPPRSNLGCHALAAICVVLRCEVAWTSWACPMAGYDASGRRARWKKNLR